jgi:hypothetical protein
MQLFKYMSAAGALRFLESGMLRFTQPVEFNDPFEMQPFLRGLADQSELETQFDDQFGTTIGSEVDAILAKLTPEQRMKVTKNALLDEVQKQAPQALALLKALAGAVTPTISDQIYKTVNEELGALCLTELPTDLLMWAHYADNHRGAVIEFDATHAFFNRRRGPNDDLRHFRPVTYTRDRPAVFLTNSDAIEFFYNKSLAWEYEREWRLILPLADCSKRLDNPPASPICLFHVPPECVRMIIVGCRMPEAEKYKLTAVARSNARYRHIEFEQADPDKRVFELQRRRITPDDLDNWIAASPSRPNF